LLEETIKAFVGTRTYNFHITSQFTK